MKIPALTLFVVVAAAAVASLSALAAKAPNVTFALRYVPAVQVVTDRGVRVQLRLESAGRFVVFGFTRCHDACPLNLNRLAQRRRDARNWPRVLFITIDPQHDDPPTLERFLRNWPGLAEGITGNPETIRTIYETFTGAPGPPTLADEHDSRIFSVDRTGTIADISAPP